jgi:hypothetical protein
MRLPVRIVSNAFRVAVAAVIACAVGIGDAHASPCTASLQSRSEIRFSFPDAASTIRDGWFLDVAVGRGAPHRVMVDTGSVGLAIAASAIPADVAPGEPASIRYSSSGKVLSGHVYRASVAFLGNAGTRTGTMPVLGVDRVTCDRTAHSDCTVEPGEADRVGVLGVGFGRHGSAADLAETLGVSERSVNPFLQLEAMRAGTIARTYEVDPNRIVLGRANDRDAARWQRVSLARGPGDDWMPLGGCFAQGPVPGDCLGGTVLVDTGVGTTIFATPQHASGSVPPGLPFEITINGAPLLGISFTSTARCEEVALSCARWSHRARYPTFVNTSRRFIDAADYRFDDACGVVEFRPRR